MTFKLQVCWHKVVLWTFVICFSIAFAAYFILHEFLHFSTYIYFLCPTIFPVSVLFRVRIAAEMAMARLSGTCLEMIGNTDRATECKSWKKSFKQLMEQFTNRGLTRIELVQIFAIVHGPTRFGRQRDYIYFINPRDRIGQIAIEDMSRISFNPSGVASVNTLRREIKTRSVNIAVFYDEVNLKNAGIWKASTHNLKMLSELKANDCKYQILRWLIVAVLTMLLIAMVLNT